LNDLTESELTSRKDIGITWCLAQSMPRNERARNQFRHSYSHSAPERGVSPWGGDWTRS